jgi:hypothetical protein
MNCQSFENIVNDLARGRIMETEKRESAGAHASDCARCAATLADAKSLAAGLRALAASREDRQAPPAVEAALLAAFRERSMSQRANAAITEPSIPSRALADDIRRRMRGWRAVAGVAAAILIIVALTIAALVPAHDGERQAVVAPDAPPARPDQKNELRQQSPARERELPVTSERDRLLAARPVSRTREIARRAQAGTRPERPEPAIREVATEFIPLAYGEYAPQSSSGHIVRVKLPRSALASFGLPVNPDRANEPVKADVLLGDDGLARAIRFVR